MLLSSSQWDMRLENEYKAMCAFPINPLFSWRITPGQTPPRVRSYQVTYNVNTKVHHGIQLRTQKKTVVQIDISESPNTSPTVTIIEGKIPFHPNWYTSGHMCPGDLWQTDPILWKFVIKIGKTLAFDPAVTNPDSAANRDAAADWKSKQVGGRGPYPCGRTDFPHPVGY